MFFDLYCLEPGQEQQGHAHAGSDKIYFVLDGVGQVEIDGESASIQAGAAVMAPSGSQHGLKNASTDRLVVLVAMAPRPPGAK
jgi:quercetin dioxygenase-like cupin family protein